MGNDLILFGPIRFLFTVVEHGTASRWKELLENKVWGAHVGWLPRFALLLTFRGAVSGVSVFILYLSSFPSRISSTSAALNKVTFVAMLLCPRPNCTICFRSSSVASLRHNEGYFLYKEPLNIRRKFPTSDPIMYKSPSPSWKELGLLPYVRTAILLFFLARFTHSSWRAHKLCLVPHRLFSDKTNSEMAIKIRRIFHVFSRWFLFII